jgi:hypothetical protein
MVLQQSLYYYVCIIFRCCPSSCMLCSCPLTLCLPMLALLVHPLLLSIYLFQPNILMAWQVNTHQFCDYIHRFSVRCFSANSTIFLSMNKPFLSRTASMYPFAMLERSAFSPRSSSSSSVLGTQNGSRSRSSNLIQARLTRATQCKL